MPARIHDTCTLLDCTKKHFGRGLCQMHYLRKWRHGSTDKAERPKTFCSIDDCGRPSHGKSMCSTHYQRWYSGSSNTGPIRPIIGASALKDLPDHLDRDRWLAYAAGFFDGEGCITIVNLKDGRQYLELACSQVDTRPLHILQSLFGGRFASHGQKVNRNCWYWKASCRQAVAALREMLPFLIVKKEQAVCALEFADTVDSKNRKRTPEKMQKREELRQRLARLKKLDFVI